MRIKTITYKRTKNLGNYENEVLELSADVGEGEAVDQAIYDLEAKVQLNIGLAEGIKQLEAARDRLQKEIADLSDRAASARQKWEKIKAFMNRLNIPLPDSLGGSDEFPF